MLPLSSRPAISAAIRFASVEVGRARGWLAGLGARARSSIKSDAAVASLRIGLEIFLQDGDRRGAVISLQVDLGQRVVRFHESGLALTAASSRAIAACCCLALLALLVPVSASARAWSSTASGRFFSTSSTRLACRSASSGSPSLSLACPSRMRTSSWRGLRSRASL